MVHPDTSSEIRTTPINKDLLSLSLQITTACNLSCIQCNFQRSILSARNTYPYHMPMDLFRKMVKQYELYIQNAPKSIVLSAGAEPMMHPSFLDLCEEVDQAGISFTFDTNATLLDIDTAKKLLSFRKFNRIAFSVDGFTAEAYESIRRGAKFSTVVGNIQIFLVLAKEYGRSDVRTEINMVVQKKNKHEVDQFILFWTPLVTQVNISTLRTGTTFLAPNWLPTERTPCKFLHNYMRVLTDGSVMACCIDDKFISKIGDINTLSLEEIWNGEEYQKLRASHDQGQYGYMPICENCDAWAGFYPPRVFVQMTDEITLGIRPVNVIATHEKIKSN